MTPINPRNIWFPGAYVSREDDEYTQLASDPPFEMLVLLVQKRAKEDGEWAIENHLVGSNEDKMRLMMVFVSDRKHIGQCLEHIFAEERDEVATVDWVCRDLATAAKYMIP